MRYNFRKYGGVAVTISKVLEHNPIHVQWRVSGGSGEHRAASFIKIDRGWEVVPRFNFNDKEHLVYPTFEEAVTGYIKIQFDETAENCKEWLPDYKASDYYNKPGGSLVIKHT